MTAWVRRGPCPWPGAPIAFFDVDETLLAGKSMFEFLRHHLTERGDGGRRYGEIVDQLRALARGGASRAEVNRRYYTAYEAVPWSELLASGRRWFADWCRRPAAFVSGGLDALRRHQRRADAVVLVSGSFLPCLGPLAEYLDVDAVLCGEPEVGAGGTLTGRIAEPMIGRAKAVAAQRFAAGRGIAPADCFAYGDHATDLDLLTAVGHPAVVGGDPALRRHAEDAGWPRWPADPVPAPPADCYCGCAVAGWSLPART